MSKNDFVKEDFNWTEEPVIGAALIITGGSIDSYANPINPDVYYNVGKRVSDGMVAIIPVNPID